MPVHKCSPPEYNSEALLSYINSTYNVLIIIPGQLGRKRKGSGYMPIFEHLSVITLLSLHVLVYFLYTLANTNWTGLMHTLCIFYQMCHDIRLYHEYMYTQVHMGMFYTLYTYCWFPWPLYRLPRRCYARCRR